MDKSNIKSYTGEGKPPTLELTFTVVPGQDNLSNLKRTIVLSGIKSEKNRLTIERRAIHVSHSTQSLNGITSIIVYSNAVLMHVSCNRRCFITSGTR